MLLGSTCLKTLGIEACAASGMATGLTAFTTAHGVVHRVHYHTTVVGATAEPAATASLTALFEGMVRIADYTYSCFAGEQDFTCLSGGQFDDSVVTFTGSELSECTG